MGTTLVKVKAAAKVGAAEKKRLAARGRKAAATVLAMKKVIKKAFYEMGRALAVLKDPGVFRAMGHPSFAELCASMKMSDSQADRLIAITEHFSAREAKELITSTKATAIIDLAAAMGGKTTPRGLLERGTVHLANGKTIDVGSASSHAIDAAARSLRANRKPSGHGGLAISPEAKRFFARLRSEAKKARLADVRIEAIASSEAEEAKMRLVAGVKDARALARALANASAALV